MAWKMGKMGRNSIFEPFSGHFFHFPGHFSHFPVHVSPIFQMRPKSIFRPFSSPFRAGGPKWIYTRSTGFQGQVFQEDPAESSEVETDILRRLQITKPLGWEPVDHLHGSLGFSGPEAPECPRDPCKWSTGSQPLGVPRPGCLRSFALVWARSRSFALFADSRLRSFELICVFLRPTAFRTTAFGNCRNLVGTECVTSSSATRSRQSLHQKVQYWTSE